MYAGNPPKLNEYHIQMENDNDIAKMKRAVAWYNMIPSMIWSIINLVPISIFCYQQINPRLLYSLLAISLLTAFLPKSFFHKLQIGKTMKVYKRIGVNLISRVTQNGEIINRFIRKRFPHYKVVSSGKHSVNRLLQQTYMFEKFHFILFLFFTLVTIYALVKGFYGWTLILLITNIIYNVYPCFLQQYIRLRLSVFQKKGLRE